MIYFRCKKKLLVKRAPFRYSCLDFRLQKMCVQYHRSSLFNMLVVVVVQHSLWSIFFARSVLFCSSCSCLDLFNAMKILFSSRDSPSTTQSSASMQRMEWKRDKMRPFVLPHTFTAIMHIAAHTAHIYRTCFMCGKIQFHVLCVAYAAMVWNTAISPQIEKT